MIPLVAIVGRPNVGKSTLFNRLVGRQAAIVDDLPGVTRDRHYADAHLQGRDLTLVDTGGFDPDSDDPMRQGIVRQVEAAIAEADVVLCVLDGSMEATLADREAVSLLRRSHKPVVYAANKIDNPARELEAVDLFGLGVEEIVMISALHGRGTAKLEQALRGKLPPAVRRAEDTLPVDLARVALIGRPNAGKSSLLNRLAGSERCLVDDEPGTTRDPIDSRLTFSGRDYLVVDTAGIRKRARVEHGIEALSVMRAIRAAERAEVVVLVCDANAGVAEQDARLLGLCTEKGRAIVVGLNKMDLLTKQARNRTVEQARIALHFAPWSPLIPISAQTGAGVRKLMATVWKAREEFRRRVPTAELNRFFEQVLERHTPPVSGGKSPRIYYITQAETSPPLFVAVTSAPQAIHPSYRRFVQNQIRKAFDFTSVPILVRFRQR